MSQRYSSQRGGPTFYFLLGLASRSLFVPIFESKMDFRIDLYRFPDALGAVFLIFAAGGRLANL